MTLAELTLQLCRIPSVTGDEGEITRYIAGTASQWAPESCIRVVGNAVVITPPAKPGLPTVALFGHTDTVKPASEQPLRLDRDRVYGCGASDMKGGLAVMLELLRLSPGMTRANPVFVFYDKEEGPIADSGLPPLFEAGAIPDGIDLAFCLEPTDNRIQAGCVGGLHAEVTFRGKRAHSARPWHGENAIYKATAYLERLRDLGRKEVRYGDLTFYEVMNATMASTANSRNVIPDAFVLNVNYRFAPGKSSEVAIQELTDLVQGEAEVKIIDVAPSGAVCLDHPFLDAWRRALGLEVEAKQAWTDVAQLTSRGIPAVNFGPGETAQAHQANESVPVAMLEANLAAFKELFGT